MVVESTTLKVKSECEDAALDAIKKELVKNKDLVREVYSETLNQELLHAYESLDSFNNYRDLVLLGFSSIFVPVKYDIESYKIGILNVVLKALAPYLTHISLNNEG